MNTSVVRYDIQLSVHTFPTKEWSAFDESNIRNEENRETEPLAH